MIRHIVFFKMKEQARDALGIENAKKLSEAFKEISAKIPGVVSVETGFNQNHDKQFYELCVNQAFQDEQSLDDYLANPLHVEVRELVFDVIDHRIVVDYSI